jgi:hypothetical protein
MSGPTPFFSPVARRGFSFWKPRRDFLEDATVGNMRPDRWERDRRPGLATTQGRARHDQLTNAAALPPVRCQPIPQRAKKAPDVPGPLNAPAARPAWAGRGWP